MRSAGRIVAQALELVRQLVEPGISTVELDRQVAAFLDQHGAQSTFRGLPGTPPFPAAICVSVEDEIVHGIPGTRMLRAGEIVSVDIGCRFNGWCADAACTYAVGEVDAVRRTLLEAGQAVLARGIDALCAVSTWRQVAREMQAEAESRNVRIVGQLRGHGIGREMHESPQLHHVELDGSEFADFNIQPGLVVAIEPVLVAGSPDFARRADGWTLATADGGPAVHFEHTVARTATGIEVLTELPVQNESVQIAAG